jgi:hypothetical protein
MQRRRFGFGLELHARAHLDAGRCDGRAGDHDCVRGRDPVDALRRLQREWVDGKIDVSAPSAFASINGQQVVTITVTPLGGTLDPGTCTATASATKPGAFVGGSSRTYTNV